MKVFFFFFFSNVPCRVVYCVVMDLAPSECRDKIDMMTAQHCDGPCRYRDGGGEWPVFTFI